MHKHICILCVQYYILLPVLLKYGSKSCKIIPDVVFEKNYAQRSEAKNFFLSKIVFLELNLGEILKK